MVVKDELRTKLYGVESPRLRERYTNLYGILCEYFESNSKEDEEAERTEDDAWFQSTEDDADELLDAIHSHYEHALTKERDEASRLRAENEALRQEIDLLRMSSTSPAP